MAADVAREADDDDLAAVRAAAERTVGAGTARISCVRNIGWQLPERPAGQRIHPFWRVAGKTVKFGWKTVGRPLLRRVSKRDELGRWDSDGFIDFAGRRFMIDSGSYAELQVKDRLWSGLSGRALSTLPSMSARIASPLWLIDLLGGIVTAEKLEPGETDEGWRHLAVTASLPEAAAKLSGDMPSPKAERYEDLLKLPFEIWLDDTGIRRLSYTEGRSIKEGGTTEIVDTVTFSDFGTSIDDLDWDRLPTFRTPDAKADKKAGKR